MVGRGPSRRLQKKPPETDEISKRARTRSTRLLENFNPDQQPLAKSAKRKKKDLDLENSSKARKDGRESTPQSARQKEVEKAPRAVEDLILQEGDIPASPTTNTTPVVIDSSPAIRPKSLSHDPTTWKDKKDLFISFICEAIIGGTKRLSILAENQNLNSPNRPTFDDIQQKVMQKRVIPWGQKRHYNEYEMPTFSKACFRTSATKDASIWEVIDDEEWEDAIIHWRTQSMGSSKPPTKVILEFHFKRDVFEKSTPPPPASTKTMAPTKAKPGSVRTTNLESFSIDNSSDAGDPFNSTPKERGHTPETPSERNTITKRLEAEAKRKISAMPPFSRLMTNCHHQHSCKRTNCDNFRKTAACIVIKSTTPGQQDPHHILDTAMREEWMRDYENGVEGVTMERGPAY
ncbi:hypothetical protein ACEPPN_006725 [Leptodophora sp. 'Broadleaf-Isolate-01']